VGLVSDFQSEKKQIEVL